MSKANVIPKVEHDNQSAHMLRKIGQIRSQNHLRQNNLVKVHTPYPKGHGRKDVVNEPKHK